MIVPLFHLIGLLFVASLISACSTSVGMKMDAAWETLDPMGHRSEHQAHHFPRGKTTGIRLPKGHEEYPLPGSSRN